MDDAAVPADAAGGAEGLAALGTTEGPLVRVRPVMHPQYIQRVKPFPARLTLELPLVSVICKMTTILG